MNKSYRNTVEIASYANKLAGITEVELFERHGKPVVEKEFPGLEEALESVVRELRLEKQAVIAENADEGVEDIISYETAAVIARTADEARETYYILKEKLEAEGFDTKERLSLLHRDSTNFKKGLTVTTFYMAKGLEFDNVFFCGAEEGIFPGMQAIYNPDQIEEERRLAYVCITRAKKQLYITNAAQRMIFGQTVRNRVSRFVTEIPAGCCDVEDKTIRKASQAELKKASTVKKTRALNDIGVGGMAAARKTTSYSSDAPSGAAAVTLKAGDRVKHNTFGEGTLVKMTPMGGDCLLEVLFDTVGTKKIMYKFAKLTKIS